MHTFTKSELQEPKYNNLVGAQGFECPTKKKRGSLSSRFLGLPPRKPRRGCSPTITEQYFDLHIGAPCEERITIFALFRLEQEKNSSNSGNAGTIALLHPFSILAVSPAIVCFRNLDP